MRGPNDAGSGADSSRDSTLTAGAGVILFASFRRRSRQDQPGHPPAHIRQPFFREDS